MRSEAVLMSVPELIIQNGVVLACQRGISSVASNMSIDSFEIDRTVSLEVLDRASRHPPAKRKYTLDCMLQILDIQAKRAASVAYVRRTDPV